MSTKKLNGKAEQVWREAFNAALSGLVNRRLKPAYVAHMAAEYARAALAEWRRRDG